MIKNISIARLNYYDYLVIYMINAVLETCLFPVCLLSIHNNWMDSFRIHMIYYYFSTFLGAIWQLLHTHRQQKIVAVTQVHSLTFWSAEKTYQSTFKRARKANRKQSLQYPITYTCYFWQWFMMLHEKLTNNLVGTQLHVLFLTVFLWCTIPASFSSGNHTHTMIGKLQVPKSLVRNVQFGCNVNFKGFEEYMNTPAGPQDSLKWQKPRVL